MEMAGDVRYAGPLTPSLFQSLIQPEIDKAKATIAGSS